MADDILIEVVSCLQGTAESTFQLAYADDPYLWASVRKSGQTIHVSIGERQIDTVSDLWAEFVRLYPLDFVGRDLKNLTATSLSWIVLHELQHAELGHFEVLEFNPSLNLVSRFHPKTQFPPAIFCRPDGTTLQCLELQADHDAIDTMLDIYSSTSWAGLRRKITSIIVVMVLIESIDEQNGFEHSTHPKAVTRIFQLLGHVVEMWSIPANAKTKARGELSILEDELPSHEEKLAFSKKVILPAFWDAVALAEVAGAKSIVADLGSPEVFFEDIGRAKLGQWDELVTVGAKQWAELKELNASVLESLGHSSI
ncbi:hypothetical protein [Cochlodiniinecator piscidefendens]|uniref:hypothetical protein n=1 Tax=Cochlodiniinecator piscidefendens TaxID=2715756 RepID=UPI00140BBFF5|nr:hypothetical protein [Cochlodiniinecator piscidefendens]